MDGVSACLGSEVCVEVVGGRGYVEQHCSLLLFLIVTFHHIFVTHIHHLISLSSILFLLFPVYCFLSHHRYQ
jgi:hypothetical protein